MSDFLLLIIIFLFVIVPILFHKEFWTERNRNKWWSGYNGHDDNLDIETFSNEIRRISKI